jgi:molybdopterin-guanine dinucleotide biosynthesis protein A
MGGRPKGLLRTPEGVTIVERWRLLFEARSVPLVLVGEATPYGLPSLPDDPPGVGPIGGLAALLVHAGGGMAIAVACDMPYVSGHLLTRLMHAPGGAPIVAARREGRWEPFFARYDAAQVLPFVRASIHAGKRSLQPLFDRALPLHVEEEELPLLRDWDTAEDIDS